MIRFSNIVQHFLLSSRSFIRPFTSISALSLLLFLSFWFSSAFLFSSPLGRRHVWLLGFQCAWMVICALSNPPCPSRRSNMCNRYEASKKFLLCLVWLKKEPKEKLSNTLNVKHTYQPYYECVSNNIKKKQQWEFVRDKLSGISTFQHWHSHNVSTQPKTTPKRHSCIYATYTD